MNIWLILITGAMLRPMTAIEEVTGTGGRLAEPDEQQRRRK